MTHLIKRSDGFQAAHNAHRYPDGTASLNEVIRDRTIAEDQPTDIYFSCDCPDGVRVGDTEITYAEYDAFHTAMTIQNYKNKFIPQREEKLNKIQSEHLAHEEQKAKITQLGLNSSLVLPHCNCERKISNLEKVVGEDRAECTKCEDENLNGKSTRLRRLQEELVRKQQQSIDTATKIQFAEEQIVAATQEKIKQGAERMLTHFTKEKIDIDERIQVISQVLE